MSSVMAEMSSAEDKIDGEPSGEHPDATAASGGAGATAAPGATPAPSADAARRSRAGATDPALLAGLGVLLRDDFREFRRGRAVGQPLSGGESTLFSPLASGAAASPPPGRAGGGARGGASDGAGGGAGGVRGARGERLGSVLVANNRSGSFWLTTTHGAAGT